MSDVHIPIEQVTRVSKGSSPGKAKFWRSLDELNDSEDVKVWLHREFPEKASEFTDAESRRQFLQLMGASVALAGLSSACTRQPAEAIVPYVKAPEQFIPGRPVYFATAISTDGAGAQGVLVESHMGRPTKIEGNPDHPGSLGSTDHLAQAEILNLYDPDRSKAVVYRTEASTWAAFVAAVRPVLEAQEALKGEGVRLLTTTVVSPTLAAQINEFLKQYPQAKWYVHDPLARRNAMDGARAAFGRALQPVYNFAEADVIVSLDADFLGLGGDKVANARAFAARRAVEAEGAGEMNRLYMIESSISITGASADHRIAARPAEVEAVAREIASELGLAVEKGSLPAAARSKSIVAAMIEDIKARPAKTLVLAGEGQPGFVHALVYAINEKLGSLGSALRMTEAIEGNPPSAENSIEALTVEMNAGKVDALFIVGGNPVLTATPDSGFAVALADQKKVALRVHLGLFDDETSEACHWHIPETHPLEAWGDTRAFDGTVSVQQPLIAPLYDGKSAQEFVQALLGDSTTSGYEIVQNAWKARLSTTGFETAWRKVVHDGVLKDTAFPPVAAKTSAGAWMQAAAASNQGDLDVVFRLDPNILDGRNANNGWMQELPKPLTKLTWDNAALLSPRTAKRLSIPDPEGTARGTFVDLVTLEVGGKSISIPAWVLPGVPDDTVTVHLGAGRKRSGRVGQGVGVDVQPLRISASPWSRAGGRITRKVGVRYALGCTQDHWAMKDASDRGLIRTGSFEKFKEEPDFAQIEEEKGEQPNMYPLHPYTGHKWGMSIDLSACIGCNACITACQSENNIAVVGKEQIMRGREMQWLRVDRYYEGRGDALSVHHQPVPCMQCENASCEVVCPVAATTHSDEGLNDMVYNRCVGTRYCANNCAYKVRRFNFFLYSDWDTESLKLQKNPDVTVRSRGVMEKCTYCVQRVNETRINAKNEGREIQDGEIKTACQQVCPTQAILFGDLNLEGSAISKKKASPRNYVLLHELNTRPRTSYLASVRNPNPSLVVKAPVKKEGEAHGE